MPQHKTIEEFNFSWQPGLNRQVIYALGTCEFIRKKENIAFIGLPGTGKTHLSIALGCEKRSCSDSAIKNWNYCFCRMISKFLIMNYGMVFCQWSNSFVMESGRHGHRCFP